MLIARCRDELDALCAEPGAKLAQRALVPTMGALHDGHLALVAAARQSGPVVVSIFVNPLQFGPGEDLARYPRDEAGDLRALEAAGCALAFLPRHEDMYPPGHATTIEVAGPASGYEGERRPGHFRGVATVVARLFGLVQPATAWFGQKDWQQLQVIRRMTADLALPVSIRDIAIVRDADGLALSSRNRFLGAAERATAPALACICADAATAVSRGAGIGVTASRAARDLERLGFAVDYLAVVDPAGLRAIERLEADARLIVAARLGDIRLLDNFAVPHIAG